MAGKHRLTQTFANQPEVRFMACSGELFHSGTGQRIGDAGRGSVQVGDTWGDDDGGLHRAPFDEAPPRGGFLDIYGGELAA